MGSDIKNIRNRFSTIILLLSLVTLTLSCASQEKQNKRKSTLKADDTSDINNFPDLGPAKIISGGISRHEISLGKEPNSRNVWIYLPNTTAGEKIPSILIGAAGSRLIDGAALGGGSDAEHIPYVKAGFAVIAYDIDGDPKDDSDDATLEAVTAFVESHAGIVNQRLALDYALEKVAGLDSSRVFIAGHSSAGTHALFASTRDPRIMGVIAYAPATDPETFLGQNLEVYDEFVPGIKKLIGESSPINNVKKISVPVFLFHSEDDELVDSSMSEKFIDELKKSNVNVTFMLVKSGRHYSSMVNQGIPAAIVWLKSTFE
jgi:dienelactone hydrolase